VLHFPHVNVSEKEDRADQCEGGEGHPPVEHHHDGEGGEDQQHGVAHIDHLGGNGQAQCLDIGGAALDEIAGFRTVVVAGGQALEVIVEPVLEAAGDPFRCVCR
jgi:hypothetical protein